MNKIKGKLKKIDWGRIFLIVVSLATVIAFVVFPIISSVISIIAVSN